MRILATPRWLVEAVLAEHTLVQFVDAALRAGASRSEVRQVLNTAGWSEDQIREALGAFSDVEFVIPVPRPRVQVSARDAFIYLVTFGALYLSAWHLGNLMFQFINLLNPSELERVASYHGQIRWATATLIIAFPVYLWLSMRTARALAADPARRQSAVRRWLIFLTLTVAAFVVLGDLISLIYGLLAGELTARFLLKSLVVAAIAGAMFGYYLWTVRADDAALGQ